MRIPVRVRQSPRYIANLAHRALLWPVPLKRQTTFRLCYFTCRSYFPYLYCSVHSLSLIQTSSRLEILVFCDRDEMLSPEQTARLSKLGVSLTVTPWDKAQGWGTKQIRSIWEAYVLAVSDLPDDAYVARIDSDVFFFSSWLFDFVAKSRADLIGDGHFVNFEYCQGGVYFLRADAILRVVSATPIDQFDAEFTRERIKVEDIAAYHLARKAGLHIVLSFFMMFPDEYANAGRLTAYQRHKFACLHYSRKNKAPMVDIYLEQIIPEADRAEVMAALVT